MRRRRDLRHALQKFDVFRAAAEFVIAQQAAERLAAEDAEFLFVDLLEHLALIELGNALQIPQDFLLGGVEDFDLEVDARFAVLDQVADAAPGGFQLLEFGVVQDLR